MILKKDRDRVIIILLKSIFILVVLSSCISVKAQAQSKRGNLRVVVNNYRNKSGQIGFYLFNSGDQFPGHTGKAILSSYVKISGITTEYTFTNVPVGTYAVYVFHDEDSNKELNTNFIGMPKEGVGVSNNAKGHFGPPKYDDAKFTLIKPEQLISISLTYL
jgi:uncharacterized protein (DUF2141 family)